MRDQGPDRLEERAAATSRAAQELADELGSSASAVHAHLALLPTRYAAVSSARRVVRHTLMTASRPGPIDVRTRVTPGEDLGEARRGRDDEQLDELDVVALDHPGWFAKVAGVLALHGGSIAGADGFSREDGLSVDTFKVRRPDGTAGSWWAHVEGDLADAAAGRLAVRARVLRKARAELPRVQRLPDVPTTVATQLDASGRSTLVEIRTVDRLGVLYSIAAAMAELEVEIVVARIQTLDHEVVDVFACRDGDGNPLTAEHVSEMSLAVTFGIDELSRTT